MSNDNQANALAQSLAPLILEALKPAITDHIESQVGGLKKKNEDLLDRLVKAKKPAPQERIHDRNGVPFDAGYTQAHEDAHLAFEAAEAERKAAAAQTRADMIEGGKHLAKSQGAHYPSREDARNPATYRAAKRAADEDGKQLVVGSPAEYNDAHNPQNANKITEHTRDDPNNGIRYMSRDRFKEIGTAVANRNAARDGLTLQFFNTDDDLPDALSEGSHDGA